jgi:hypothetical protein
VYAPACFDALSRWLAALGEIAAGTPPSVAFAACEATALAAGRPWIDPITAVVRDRPPSQVAGRLHESFGALETLRFIHAVRAQGHPNVALGEAKAPWLEGLPPANDLQALREAIAARDEGLPKPQK